MTDEEFLKKNQSYIERLSRLSAGDLAGLRRAKRDILNDDRILSVLAGLGALERYREPEALIAVLYAWCHRPGDRPFRDVKFNFGHCFRLAMANGSDHFEAEKGDGRFKALIASNEGSFFYRLRQAVRLIHSRGGKIDFAILLSDVRNWSRADRWVKRKWARGFYNIVENSKNESI